MNNPKISIIIPVYNVEEYIERCLNSVAKQTYNGAIECVIVDDRGNDSSIDIVQKFIRDYDGPISFKLEIRENNGGLSAARNTGINKSTGDYLFFLDSDDEITENCIEELSKPLQRRGYDVIVGRFYSDDGSEQSAMSYYKGNCELLESKIVSAYNKSEWCTQAWNKLCRKEFLVKDNLYFCEGLLHEDILWSFQVASTAKAMYLIDVTTYYYRIRANSIMTKKGKDQMLKRVNSLQEIMSKMCEFTRERALVKNPDVNFSIQRWFTSAMNITYNICSEDMGKTYRIFRAIAAGYSVRPIWNQNATLKQKIKCAHWFMPQSVGWYYIRLLQHFI